MTIVNSIEQTGSDEGFSADSISSSDEINLFSEQTEGSVDAPITDSESTRKSSIEKDKGHGWRRWMGQSVLIGIGWPLSRLYDWLTL